MAFLDKNAIFRPYFELEAIARQSVEASREVICAYFGNIDRNSGYFLLRIFLSSHPSGHHASEGQKTKLVGGDLLEQLLMTTAPTAKQYMSMIMRGLCHKSACPV